MKEQVNFLTFQTLLARTFLTSLAMRSAPFPPSLCSGCSPGSRGLLKDNAYSRRITQDDMCVQNLVPASGSQRAQHIPDSGCG